ncbi:uncharacterized protein LOC116343496 [Contarinia nasturtii]|uniref:uncharacterized protein LOC116343496 n=1 Tax=Contarinia nasturtii TaxID=265458 RepID=UPI0012D4990F|nr:uncharacterized protein LOC116343496 [Contarinia nasturtii]
MCHSHSCQRGTNRWPFAFFMNLINVCGVAAFVVYNTSHDITHEQYAFQRKTFLIELYEGLVYDHIVRRTARGMNASNQSAFKEVREHLLGQEEQEAPVTPRQRRACHLCPSSINRKTKTCCDKCNKNQMDTNDDVESTESTQINPINPTAKRRRISIDIMPETQNPMLSEFVTQKFSSTNYRCIYLTPFSPSATEINILNHIRSQNRDQTEVIELSTHDIYYQNVRGLRTKSKQFFEFFDNSYHVYRKDRYETGSSLCRGGGILIAVNSKLSSTNIMIDDTNQLECVCVKVNINSKFNVFIYAAYIPPNSQSDIYKCHSNAINHIPLAPNDTIIVMGDFNLPLVNWLTDDTEHNVLIPTCVTPQYAADFIEDISTNGLYQINSIRNASSKLLDLIFTNDFINVEISCPPPLSAIDEQYHPPIMLTYEWHINNSSVEQIQTRNFFKADYIAMNRYFAEIDFSQRFSNKSLDEKVDILHQILNEAISKYVPTQTKKIQSKCPWKNKQLQSLKNKKNKEWKRSKLTGENSSHLIALDNYTKLNTELYNTYVDKMTSSLKSDPSSFWRFVNTKKNSDYDPKLLHFGEKSSSDKKEQAEMFATFFKNNFANQPSQFQNAAQMSPQSISNMDEYKLNEFSVFNELLQINSKKGAGPDGIHPILLKNCAALLYEPLSTIFNESLSTGNFPTGWKRYSVGPIFKKGSRSNVENYRCIAKLPTIAKFFEYLINLDLSKMVADKIVPQQHGFMKGRSTSSNLLEFSHYSIKALNDDKQVEVLYTDFSKAFDIVDHSILISKLQSFHLPPNLIEWIKSYLSNRRQFVKYGQMDSSEFVQHQSPISTIHPNFNQQSTS